MNTDTGWTNYELINIAIFFTMLIGMLLFSTWRMIKGKQWYWLICTPLMWAGILCWICFIGFQSPTDETGMVPIDWTWLLLGSLLFSLGCVGALLRGVIVLGHHVWKCVFMPSQHEGDGLKNPLPDTTKNHEPTA